MQHLENRCQPPKTRKALEMASGDESERVQQLQRQRERDMQLGPVGWVLPWPAEKGFDMFVIVVVISNKEKTR